MSDNTLLDQYPLAYALFIRSPGMSWPEALRRTGEGGIASANRLATSAAAEADRFDRQAAIREKAGALIAQGQSREQAVYNAARAIAYERNEAEPGKPIESMSLAELQDSLRAFD